MNTLRKYGAKYNVTFCTFAGLSTDTKPVGTTLIDNKSVALANGSEFIEMDTNKKYLYDAESQTWNLADSGGGGGSATLIEKSITENGEYNASADNADGYKKVTVDVAGGGSSTTSKKDVNFYDYDGTIVNSYTASEFAELSALPDNPTHDGLTAQGWNWSLADAKNYVASYGKLEIGQMYITDNGETRLYITLSEGRTSPVLDLSLNWYSELDIDWGDGGAHSTFTYIDPDYPSRNHTSERHEYNSTGNYVIRIKVVEGSFKLSTSASYVSSILGDGNRSSSSPDAGYWNAIKRIEVGSNVEGINPYTFYSCYSLTSITIPNSITSIGDSAFSRCYSLTSITIPNSITSIGDSAFSSCYSLTSITIPKSVTNIGSGICNNCYLLSSITIPDGIASISAQVFQNCYSLSSIIMPDSVTSIGNNAFRYCSSLQSIAIPNSVTRIDKAAFQNCTHLSTITLPDNITTIAEQMFNYCYSLSSILIPDSVTKIDTYAFQGCSSLTSIVIPSSVTSIGSIAFGNCYSLATITIDKSEGSISGSPWGAVTGSPTNTQIIWAG